MTAQKNIRQETFMSALPDIFATVDKKNVNLTLKEYEVLCLLLKNSGTVLSRTQLLNQVWGYEFDGESRTVDVHIRTLRQKTGKCR